MNRFFRNASCVVPFSSLPKMVWNRPASPVSSSLFSAVFFPPSLSPLFFCSAFHGSCQCLISVTGQCWFKLLYLRVCVTAFDTLTFLQPLAVC